MRPRALAGPGKAVRKGGMGYQKTGSDEDSDFGDD